MTEITNTEGSKTPFRDWVMRAKITDDPAGDLIGDIRRDTRLWCRPLDIHSAAELRAHLRFRSACDGALKAAGTVWRRYERRS